MSDKVRTLIVIDNMYTGGIATSLYNFLTYKPDYLECDLLCFNTESIDLERIPSNVNIIEPSRLLLILGFSQAEIKTKSICLALLRMAFIVLTRLLGGQFARRLLLSVVRSNYSYDLAISYAHDNGWKSLSKGCNDYVAYKVKSGIKLSYVHCDYKNYGGYDKRQQKVFDKFDYIAMVSESCKDSFCEMFPDLSKKAIVLENFTNVDRIKRLSDYSVSRSTNSEFSFVTVCRLSKVKGLDRTIHAFYELQLEGYSNYFWTIVGDGPEHKQLETMVRLYNLDNRIRFVGNQENPYPYIKGSTAFLLPSIHEAAPMVFAESAVLGVPVITTNTCSSKELVSNRNIGIVIDNDEISIKKILREVLSGNVDLSLFARSDCTINENAMKQLRSFLNNIKQ